MLPEKAERGRPVGYIAEVLLRVIPKAAAERHGLGVLAGSVDGREALISKLKDLLPGAVTEDGLVDVAELRKAVGNEYVEDNNQNTSSGLPARGLPTIWPTSPQTWNCGTERGQSKDFDETSNVVMRGDNLDVLRYFVTTTMAQLR